MFPSENETSVTLETEISGLVDEPPFHILLLGDWSGRENHPVNSLPEYQPVEIDRDNFDDVIRKLSIQMTLDFQGGGENTLAINLNEFEDFHPDAIFRQLPVFENLRDVRRRLLKEDTFETAAGEVRSWLSGDNENSNSITEQNEHLSETDQSSSDLLDQILGKTTELTVAVEAQTLEKSEFNRFVRNIVQPHLIKTDTAEQSRLLMVVDEVISDMMRKILHHPKFQALESAWRGVFFLVKRIETDFNLKIYLLDISKNEIADDLKSIEDLTDSRFYKLLNNKSENNNWTVVCGNYTFSPSVDDIATLIRVAKIVDSADIPFLAHLTPEIFGFRSLGMIKDMDDLKVSPNSTEEKLWTALRNLPEAERLGLSISRFLTRLPYGERTEPTEVFSFEEFTGDIRHEQYLWSNPCFAVTLLLAQSFSRFGWDFMQNLLQDITNLPVHFCESNGENKSKPCAEFTMTGKNYQLILDNGLMPLISYKNTDRIRLGRLQSVAASSAPLRAFWNKT